MRQGCTFDEDDITGDDGGATPVVPDKPWCHLSLTTQAPNGFTGTGDQERDECIDLTSSRARSQGWQTCGDVANHRWSDEPICPRGWDCESFVPNDYATRAECEQGAREWRGGGDMGEEQRDCGVDLGSVAGSARCATARASQEAVCDDDYDLCLRNCTIITDEECGPFYCLRTVKGPCDVVVSNNHQACLETDTHYCDGVPLPIEIPCDP